WIKSALDEVIHVYLNAPDLEFVWVGDDAVDPLQQAQTLNILVAAGIKTIAEARAELGLGPGGKAAPAFGKYNSHHDEIGRFTTADNAVAPGAGRAQTPKGVQVAANDAAGTKSGPGAAVVAQGAPEDEPKPESESESEGGTYFDPATGRWVTLPPGSAIGPGRGWIDPRSLPRGPTYLEPPSSNEDAEADAAPQPRGTVADAVAPNGILPGDSSAGLGNPRTMPPSNDPNVTALNYIGSIYSGQTPTSVTAGGKLPPGSFIVGLPDGTFITFRPAGGASSRTLDGTANVDINSPAIRTLNNGSSLKLKFPRK
ncbi:MAG TPA: hypothetical protein VGH13_18755, partial [Xanthobacteraceae bacterium]